MNEQPGGSRLDRAAIRDPPFPETQRQPRWHPRWIRRRPWDARADRPRALAAADHL